MNVGNYLKAYLISDETMNIKVKMTRTEDVFIPLINRPNLANVDLADLFISIHLNTYSKGL